MGENNFPPYLKKSVLLVKEMWMDHHVQTHIDCLCEGDDNLSLASKSIKRLLEISLHLY